MFQTQVTKPPHSRSNDLHLCDAIRCSDRTLEAFFTDGIQWTPIRTPEEDHPPTSSGLLDVKMSTANDLKPATSTSCASSVGYFSANSSLSSNVSLTFDRDKKTIQGKQTQATIASQINEHNTSMKMVASVTSTSASSLSLPASADNTMQPRSSSSFSKSATSPPQQQHQTSYQFRCQQHLLAQHSSDHNFHHHQHHHFESSHQVSHNESNEHQHLPQTSQSVSSSTSCTAPTSMLVMNGTAMSLSSVQPLIAMRRVMLLYENLQHEEAANFVLRLNESTFALVARELPIGLFIEQMPQSLHVLEALYAKLLLGAQSSRCALSTCPVYAQLLKTLQPESVTMHLVKLFALRTQTSHVLTSSGNGNSGNSSSGHHNQHSNNEPSVLHCTLPTPFADRLDSNQLLMLTIRKLLRAILQVQPAIRKQLAARKRAIDGAIDALGHHGLVSVSGGTSIGNGDLWSGSAHGSTSNVSTGGSLMLSLQDAIRLECEQLVQQQRAILNKLDQTYGGDSSFKSSGLSSSVRISKASGTLIRSASVASAIVSGTTSAPPIAQANGSASSTAGSVCNKGTLPVGASHQRQLSLRPDQIQNRLLRNKQLLNSLEQFTGGQQSLQLLMQMLDARIQYDKETLFQFAQLRKEFNYCCTVSRRLCGALLGNAGVSTLDGAHSCMNATGSTSSNGSSNNSNGSGGHSSSRASGGSNAGQSSGSSPSGNNSSGSNGHAIVTNHVMGCCIESNAVVAPVLMRFSFGCAQVLQLFDQVSSEVESSLATSLIGSAHAINECPKHSSAGIVFDDCNGNDHNNASTNVPPTEFCSTDNKDDTSSGNDTKQLSTLQQKIISNETTPTPSSNTSTTMIRCNETVIHRTKDGNEIQCEPIKTDKMNNYRNSIPIGLLVDVTEAKADDSAQSSVELPPIAIKEGIWTQQINEPITIRATNSYNLPETIERLKRAEAEVVRLQQVEQELSRRLQQSKMIESSDVQSAIDCDSANISLNTTSHLSIDCSNSKRLRMQRMIRLYGDLYSQARVDTLEALDRLDQLRDVSDLKNKLLFSVLVLSFRAVQKSITQLKQSVCSLLNMKSMPNDSNTSVIDIHHQKAMIRFESALNSYLCDCSNQFDLSAQIKEVHQQICATLYEYVCLRDCAQLRTFIGDCVRVAWSLSSHSPAFVIRFDSIRFDPKLHVRFHTSSVESVAIQGHIWPALCEEEGPVGGDCVYKGVVIT